MKAILLTCLASFFIQCAFSQDSTGNKFLMITIQPVWNKTNKQYNYLLKADAGVAEASPLYALKPVLDNNEIDNDHVYAATTIKSPLPDYRTGYNNFPNESSVLNFITANGWQLHSVIPQVQTISDYNYNRAPSYSNVHSITKYLFTRVVK